jgi:Glycosyltransferase Family 4
VLQITRAFAKTADQFSRNVVHFRNLMGLSAKMIDECHRRGIPTVLTLHDHWRIWFKSLMLKNDGAVCTRGGFDCLDCKETLTETLTIPSPIRNAHILLSLRKVDRLIAPSYATLRTFVASDPVNGDFRWRSQNCRVVGSVWQRMPQTGG